MKNDIFIVSHSIISPLGYGTHENFDSAFAGKSGITEIHDDSLSPFPFFGAKIDENELNERFGAKYIPSDYTLFEKLLILSVDSALRGKDINPASPDTLFFISTTKGNIALLDEKKRGNFAQERINLWHTARLLKEHYKSAACPIIISNACISGVSALISALRILDETIYNNAIVCGADILSSFVISGFHSFQALSSCICKPFDENRDGINLGEAAGTIILTKKKKDEYRFRISGASVSNDANHISGPSRTGDGLELAIRKSLEEASLPANELDFVSAHGTATPYNDEMECLAFGSAGLSETETNSMKAYFGHTLGAAGLIESAMTLESMERGELLKSAGYEKHGVSKDLNIIKENKKKEIKRAIKTASGFGGCNAAIVFEKI